MGRATAKEEREIKADRGILELGGREGGRGSECLY